MILEDYVFGTRVALLQPIMEPAKNTISSNKAAARLTEGRNRLLSAFFEKGKTADFLFRHTALLDQYFLDSFESSRIGPQMQFHKQPYAMIALGGYGRQEQCLHSDIDILLLFEKSVPVEAEQLIREVLYPLWDMGFDVGHATRSIKDCLRLAADDIDVMTALLDSRFICGMSMLYAQLRERLGQALTGSRAKKAVNALIQSSYDRHAKFGDSSYLLEPNLKDGQGGLRDYHTLLWIARIQSKIIQPRDLEFQGYLSCDEFQRLNQALGFIWKVRSHLHHLTRRKFDQLYFEHQQTLAARLKFKDTNEQLAVERFLGKLHSEMAFIKQTNLVFLSDAIASRPSLLKITHRKTTEVKGLQVEGNQIGFVSTEFIPRQPDLLLKVFDESARLKLALSWEARRVIKEFSYLIDKHFRTNPANVKIFERILKTPAGKFNVLNEMLQTGFLERFIPAIKSIKNRIQYDGYHLYPIDRHSLRTVRIMKTFSGKTSPSPLLAELYREVGKQKPILLWATLLHDIGKGKSGGHSERGARIASRILKNMGYPPEQVDTVNFLIENHLFLAKTATRRDTNDEETAIFCGRKIKDIKRLKMLYLLTVADSMATGPKAWNDWTAELMRDLFFKTLHILEKGELASSQAVEAVTHKKQLLLASARTDREKTLLEAHLAVLPPRYFLYQEEQAIIDHLSLAQKIQEQPFAWKISHGDNTRTRTVTICAKDQPGLFSKIAGAFTINNIDILEAEIYTWKNDIALDIFTLRPPADQIYEDLHWEKTARHLRSILNHELDPARALSEKQVDIKRFDCVANRPHRVVIDNKTSGFFTIIEVFTNDCPGLLFHITDTLFRYDLDVRIAKIGTKIDQVVDVFYVRDRYGQKFDRPDQIEALKKAIEDVLSNLL